MEKTYNPSAIEQEIYRNWENKKYFRPSMDLSRPAFSICLPPPNVTGSLHMGHAFQQTIMDILIRYHRMLGDNTLWQAGTDHAGIATQMVVLKNRRPAMTTVAMPLLKRFGNGRNNQAEPSPVRCVA